MNATLQILEAAGAALEIETIEIGEKVYLRGNSAGIDPSSWDSLLRTKVFLKAPITTPQGGGFKSLNVTTRKTLGQYANVRPCVSYHPFIDTKHPNMDVVIVRENEEDLYAGHRIPDDARSDVLHQADLAAGQRKDRALRVRVRAAAQSQEGHLLHEGQHHEDDRRPVPQGVRRDRRAVSGYREGSLDRGYRRGEDGRHAGGVRRDRDAESLRRHSERRGGADRRVRWDLRVRPISARAAPCSKRSTARRRGARDRTWPILRGCCWARC